MASPKNRRPSASGAGGVEGISGVQSAPQPPEAEVSPSQTAATGLASSASAGATEDKEEEEGAAFGELPTIKIRPPQNPTSAGGGGGAAEEEAGVQPSLTFVSDVSPSQSSAPGLESSDGAGGVDDKAAKVAADADVRPVTNDAEYGVVAQDEQQDLMTAAGGMINGDHEDLENMQLLRPRPKRRPPPRADTVNFLAEQAHLRNTSMSVERRGFVEKGSSFSWLFGFAEESEFKPTWYRKRSRSHIQVGTTDFKHYQQLEGIEKLRQDCEERYALKSVFKVALERISRLERQYESTLGLLNHDIERMKGVDQAQEDKIEEFEKKVQQFGEELLHTSNRLRDEQHRTENTADVAMKTGSKIGKVTGHLKETKEALRDDVSRLAKSVQALAQEVKDMGSRDRKFVEMAPQSLPVAPSSSSSSSNRASFHTETKVSTAGGGGGGGGGGGDEGARGTAFAEGARGREYVGGFSIVTPLEEVKKQIASQEIAAAAMERDLSYLKTEMGFCAKANHINELEKQLEKVADDGTKLNDFVTEQFFASKMKAKTELIGAFLSRWEPYRRTQSLREVVTGWMEFVQRQNKYREALHRCRSVYARTHVTSRLRSWWYIMTRDKGDADIKKLSDVMHAQEVKLGQVRTELLRNEKLSTEQARGLQHRIIEVEKGLDRAHLQFTSKDEVMARLDDIQRKIDEELSVTLLSRKLNEVTGQVQELRAQKVEVKQADEDRQKVVSLERELRAWLQHHDEDIKLKASLGTIDLKADAKAVESALVLLARQADQLAKYVASDIDQVRQALTRFLEISPDHRKASLAIGMEPTEQCVSCRQINKKMLTDLITGGDGAVYKVATDTNDTASEQTKRVLAEKLRFPLSLSSSMAAGTTVAIPENDDQSEAMPQLRRMLAAKEGWLSVTKEQPAAATGTDQQQQPPSAALPPMWRPQSSGRNSSGSGSGCVGKEALAALASSVVAGSPRNKGDGTARRPPSAQETSSRRSSLEEATPRSRAAAVPWPQQQPSSRSYFPAVECGAARGATTPRKARAS